METRGVVQHLRTGDYADMLQQVADAIYAVVFREPVKMIREVDPDTATVIKIQNAPMTPLERALRSGRIQYLRGVFSGEFDARTAVEIRRLGGKFDKRLHVYFIEIEKVPAWVKASAEDFRSISKNLHEALEQKLGEIEANVDQLVAKRVIDASKTVEKIQEGFKRSADAIGVHPTITRDSQDQLAKEYSDNMKLYIRDFSKSAIQSLRDVVEDNAQKGYRFDRLIDVIRQRYGVARSKAEFLARQETSLFMSKYRKMRFKEGGVTRYRWSTSHDEKVRKRHAELDGRTFSYDQPPIVDKETGRTGNPGEDFNCRCVDMPIVERFEEAMAA